MLALGMALLCGGMANGVAGLSLAQPHAQHAQDVSKEVTFVIVDHNAKHEFDCWLKNFNNVTSHAPVVAFALDSFMLAHVNTHVNSDNANLRVDDNFITQHRNKSFASWPPELYQRAIWDAFKMLFASGVRNVLHSDTDAFFHTKDIWTVLRDGKLSNLDLVSSLDHCYPEDVCTQWKYMHTLNPGFMLFRNTPAMNEVLDHLIKVWDDGKQPHEKHDHSDLHMLNRYLAYDKNCTWEPSDTSTTDGEMVRLGNCQQPRLKMGGLSEGMVKHTGEGKYVTHMHARAEAYC